MDPGSFAGCIYSTDSANATGGHGVCDTSLGYYPSWEDGETGTDPWEDTEDAYCIEAAYLAGQ